MEEASKQLQERIDVISASYTAVVQEYIRHEMVPAYVSTRLVDFYDLDTHQYLKSFKLPPDLYEQAQGRELAISILEG